MDVPAQHPPHAGWRVAARNTVVLQLSFMPPTYLLLYGVPPALWQGEGEGRLLDRLVAGPGWLMRCTTRFGIG
ncbi:MAG TPA: hypothetical protein VF629_13135 [Hymenobacter sp.]|uniref:hypothetical protein n=1 Tax=Hymenobacter sp. TaxID=1898978 RepID=UPI002ED781D6